ncbi:MAG: argininosuccinate lyase [Candidatus Omnitrophota bacterium]
MKKMWGGRFKKRMHPLFEAFSAQSAVDAAFLEDDLQGSIAYAKMLGKIGILKKAETARLVRALSRMLNAASSGKLLYDETAEDVHTFVEARLEKEVGALAQKLHTGRSRNEQVSLDTRLYCKRGVLSLFWHIAVFQKALVQAAKKYRTVILPGYTHLQHAQPVLLAHHLLAYCQMLERDKERLQEALYRVDVLPLGSGALAGSSFPIDRKFLARELGFSRISENSLDAVSDRDFVIEILSALSLLAMHLSRLSEDFILWSTREFGFIELGETLCTGSSLMPQKKNPDFLELVRGEAGRVYGNLMTVLSVMKGLPLSYNRDMQLDKAPLLDAMMRLHHILALFPILFKELKVRPEPIRLQLADEDLLATDLAEFLVGKGVPFRKAHETVGKLFRFVHEKNRRLSSLSLSELRKFSPKFDQTFYKLLSADASIRRKKTRGGTGVKEVNQQIRQWEEKLSR